MDLSKALRLGSVPRVALVGAGGKTTALFHLARQLVSNSSRVVFVTATTHLGRWQLLQADGHLIVQDAQDIRKINRLHLSGVVVLSGGEEEDERLAGLTPTCLESLLAYADSRQIPVLIEADGARQRPLKAPADHEPAIPPFVDTVVVLAGLTGYQKPLSEAWVHRPERFAELSGLEPDGAVTLADIERVLTHPLGGLKNIPEKARRVVLLNQADTPELCLAAAELANPLLHAYQAVIVASLGVSPDPLIHAVHERVAGIVLAAGSGSRFVQAGETLPKQLLSWHGMSFVRRVTLTALQAGLSPVVVVSGAHRGEVEAAVNGLPVVLAHNPAWEDGQSTSIHTGLHHIPAQVGAAVFLLADQPAVTVELVMKLVEAHSRELTPLVAPLVQGRRANPVLFDRDTFADLMAIQGDVGGRALFDHYPIHLVPWEDHRLLVDVDTPEDYQNLMQSEGDGL